MGRRDGREDGREDGGKREGDMSHFTTWDGWRHLRPTINMDYPLKDSNSCGGPKTLT